MDTETRRTNTHQNAPKQLGIVLCLVFLCIVSCFSLYCVLFFFVLCFVSFVLLHYFLKDWENTEGGHFTAGLVLILFYQKVDKS